MQLSKSTVNSQSFEQDVNHLLNKLTLALQQQSLWQKYSPNLSQLASSAPFCCDTLAFEQWLQFVFIGKIKTMMVNDISLPNSIALKPMAEESFKHLAAGSKLINIVADIDRLFTAPR